MIFNAVFSKVIKRGEKTGFVAAEE